MSDIRVTIQIDVTAYTDDQRRRISTKIQQFLEEIATEATEPTLLTGGGWTVSAVQHALHQLIVDGYANRVEVIRVAAEQGGVITRADVYRVAGYSDGENLRGFTRPINTIRKKLQAAQQIPDDAEALLSTDYDPSIASYQRAPEFSIPAAILPVVRAALSNLEESKE
ncbi:hypothetical protein [Nocardia sp. XZ_19_385]|uniref:hypothetical protein n=1 Tax=Nocardia sp. XZ_19_385 TaxID=2769488 RepID=UPI00188F3869|nr:hypothetical protein [Nocardia sp. XZ_19_385]